MPTCIPTVDRLTSAELASLPSTQEVAAQVSMALVRQVECVLRNAIAAREGDREWSPEEIRRYMVRYTYPNGLHSDPNITGEYRWKGVPILRVSRHPDPIRYSFILTELQPEPTP